MSPCATHEPPLRRGSGCIGAGMRPANAAPAHVSTRRAPASFVRRAVIAFIVLAVAAGIAVGARRYIASTQPKTTYQTSTVARGRITAKVTATGTLSAHVTVLVGSQVSG